MPFLYFLCFPLLSFVFLCYPWFPLVSRPFEGSENGKVQKVSPTGIDWQRETVKNKLNISNMARNVTFITKKVDSASGFDNQNSLFLLISVTFRAIFEIFILSLWRVAKMVKCKKSAPEAFTKGNCLGLQKSSIFIIFTVKRNVFGHFGHVHSVIWELGRPGFPSET